MRLTPHFELRELLPDGPDGKTPVVPVEVFENLSALAELLERAREIVGRSIVVHSAYRTPDHNAAVGGAPHSDHMFGRAADFHVAPEGGETWQEATLAAWPRLLEQLAGFYGQIILEDRRAFTGRPTSLCIHLASPSERHPGTASDASRILVSREPGKYEVFRPTDGPFVSTRRT